MTTPNRNKTIDRARFLIAMAKDVGPVDLQVGLTALQMAGVDQALAEKYRLDNQATRAQQEPDGWCRWCSRRPAKRWIEVNGSSMGVCDHCYADLNRGR